MAVLYHREETKYILFHLSKSALAALTGFAALIVDLPSRGNDGTVGAAMKVDVDGKGADGGGADGAGADGVEADGGGAAKVGADGTAAN